MVCCGEDDDIDSSETLFPSCVVGNERASSCQNDSPLETSISRASAVPEVGRELLVSASSDKVRASDHCIIVLAELATFAGTIEVFANGRLVAALPAIECERSDCWFSPKVVRNS